MAELAIHFRKAHAAVTVRRNVIPAYSILEAGITFRHTVTAA